MTENNTLIWLQNWYLSQCNDLWEHGYGIDIQTIDNPGWSVKINLADTVYENNFFETVRLNRSDSDWIIYWCKNSTFEAAGGANNLEEILKLFKEFIEK